MYVLIWAFALGATRGLGPARITSRLEALRRRATAEGLDGILLQPGPNMRYLLNIVTASYERLTLALLSFVGPSFILVPRLDLERVGDQLVLDNVEILSYTDDEDPWPKVAEMLRGAGVEGGGLGVEGSLPYSIYSSLKGLSEDLTLRVVDGILHGLRAVKDDVELEAHRKASEILRQALRETLGELREGMGEREVRFLFEQRALALGAESVPFCLVQSGPNGAKPHLEPTGRRIGRGEPVVFDAGVTYQGYHADVTRTVCLGDPVGDVRRVFEVVLEAQAGAIERVGPGVRAEELDRVARGVIARHGYAPYFTHRTGHGLGLEVHEEPYIREGSRAVLERGMVFTIEPGIYLPGRFGVRLEDNLVVTGDGYENLTRLPKTLHVGDYL